MTARHVETTTVPADQLHPYPGNAKLHDQAALTASIETLGQYRAIVARRLPDGHLQILAGHGTAQALAAAGQDVRVEVIDADDRTARRVVLADNRIGTLAGYDDTALLALLDAANADGGLAATGYDETAYQDLLASVAPVPTPDDVDDVPEPPDEPLTRPGSIWTLGRHRLVCGSALQPDTITTALGPDCLPDLVHADPPYGIDIVRADGTIGSAGHYKPVIGDDSTTTAVQAFELLGTRLWSTRHIWWGANHYAGDITDGLPNASCWLVWDKQNGGMSFADAELAWTNHPGAARLTTHRWMGSARASETGPRHHPNQKPVAVIRWAIETVLDQPRPGTLVLDPFAGSGPTLLAAELLGIDCAAIELDPAYCDVIAHRWADLTGQTPHLDGEPITITGQTHRA